MEIPDKSVKGRRVRLVKLNEHSRTLSPGDGGSVLVVDALGTVHVEWDNGIGLGLIEGEGYLWVYVD